MTRRIHVDLPPTDPVKTLALHLSAKTLAEVERWGWRYAPDDTIDEVASEMYRRMVRKNEKQLRSYRDRQRPDDSLAEAAAFLLTHRVHGLHRVGN